MTTALLLDGWTVSGVIRATLFDMLIGLGSDILRPRDTAGGVIPEVRLVS